MVDEQHAEDRERHRDPLLAVIGDGTRSIEVAALRLAHLLGDVAGIDKLSAYSWPQLLAAIMISGPVFDWIADVIRACTPSPLMVLILSDMPSAF
jgi:hypothetical protein